MASKLSPEQSAKVKALFKAALSLPEGILIPKPTSSQAHSMKTMLFSEKKSWATSDPRLHVETAGLTVRLEKDSKGAIIGVRIIEKPDPTAGLEYFIAQAQLKGDKVTSTEDKANSPLERKAEEARKASAQSFEDIQRDLEDRLRQLGLSQTDDTSAPAFSYGGDSHGN